MGCRGAAEPLLRVPGVWGALEIGGRHLHGNDLAGCTTWRDKFSRGRLSCRGRITPSLGSLGFRARRGWHSVGGGVRAACSVDSHGGDDASTSGALGLAHHGWVGNGVHFHIGAGVSKRVAVLLRLGRVAGIWIVAVVDGHCLPDVSSRPALKVPVHACPCNACHFVGLFLTAVRLASLALHGTFPMVAYPLPPNRQPRCCRRASMEAVRKVRSSLPRKPWCR